MRYVHFFKITKPFRTKKPPKKDSLLSAGEHTKNKDSELPILSVNFKLANAQSPDLIKTHFFFRQREAAFCVWTVEQSVILTKTNSSLIWQLMGLACWLIVMNGCSFITHCAVGPLCCQCYSSRNNVLFFTAQR